MFKDSQYLLETAQAIALMVHRHAMIDFAAYCQGEQDIDIQNKGTEINKDLVTRLDKATEFALMQALPKLSWCKGAIVTGEETIQSAEDYRWAFIRALQKSARVFIVDPVDGTKSLTYKCKAGPEPDAADAFWGCMVADFEPTTADRFIYHGAWVYDPNEGTLIMGGPEGVFAARTYFNPLTEKLEFKALEKLPAFADLKEVPVAFRDLRYGAAKAVNRPYIVLDKNSFAKEFHPAFDAAVEKLREKYIVYTAGMEYAHAAVRRAMIDPLWAGHVHGNDKANDMRQGEALTLARGGSICHLGGGLKNPWDVRGGTIYGANAEVTTDIATALIAAAAIHCPHIDLNDDDLGSPNEYQWSPARLSADKHNWLTMPQPVPKILQP